MMNFSVTWDDQLGDHELGEVTPNCIFDLLRKLNGHDRTLVTISREDGHLACGGSCETGLVLYVAKNGEVFWQLLGSDTSEGIASVNAGGQLGNYLRRYIVDVDSAVLVTSSYLEGEELLNLHSWDQV